MVLVPSPFLADVKRISSPRTGTKSGASNPNIKPLFFVALAINGKSLSSFLPVDSSPFSLSMRQPTQCFLFLGIQYQSHKHYMDVLICQIFSFSRSFKN